MTLDDDGPGTRPGMRRGRPAGGATLAVWGLAWLLGACGGATLRADLPPGATALRLGAAHPTAPFAPHPDGLRVAFSDAGLTLASPGQRRALDPRVARALCWSASGQRLAAAFDAPEGTEVRVLDLAGESTVTMRLPGAVVALRWRPGGELLALAIKQRAFRFGVQVQTWLFERRGPGPPRRLLLDEHTAPPQRPGAPPVLGAPVFVDLSPLGDELLYTRARHPPAIIPYLEVQLRHLGGGAERSVMRTGLASGGALFGPDGERVLVSDGIAQVVWRSAWGGGQTQAAAAPGKRLALSPGGRYLYVDGVLTDGGRVIGRLPPRAEARFSARGDALALRHEGTLWLLRGLRPDPAPALDPTFVQRILPLRRWRAQGLIDAGEYDKRKAALRP